MKVFTPSFPCPLVRRGRSGRALAGAGVLKDHLMPFNISRLHRAFEMLLHKMFCNSKYELQLLNFPNHQELF